MSKESWVTCPICGETDMRKEIVNDEGDALIHCVNHVCASNGGHNAEALGIGMTCDGCGRVEERCTCICEKHGKPELECECGAKCRACGYESFSLDECMMHESRCPGSPETGLTSPEQVIMDNLADVWNNFTRLPMQHPDDQGEFRHALHRLQHIMMARVVRRTYDGYTNDQGKM